MKTYDTFKAMSIYLPHENGKASTMNFGLVDKRPRISVFLNDAEDGGFKLVNIKLTFIAVATLLGLIKKATELENPDFTFNSFDTVFTEDGERTQDVKLIGSMKIHRDARGLITLSVKVVDGKTYPFIIKLQNRYHIVKSTDKDITDSKGLSNVTVAMFIDMLLYMFATVVHDNRHTVER